jgi:YbgC/YbaW family acyl-CoA thioester hydrolase
MDLSKFKHKSTIQIRFKDIDHMGHVNNANHITYFELARIHYFRDVINEVVNWNEQGVILAKTEINYHRPILLSDNVFVYSRVSKMGNKSYEVESTFYDAFWGQWIAELLSSPEVYMETASGLVAVVIEDSQIKIEETNELVNVTLTIVEANEISVQQN